MFCANIYGPLDRGMIIDHITILPLEFFTQRNFVADLIRLKLNCLKKTKINQ